METLAQQMIAGDEKLRQVLSGHAATDRTNLSELCKRIDAAQAKSAAGASHFRARAGGRLAASETDLAITAQ
jgi:hypothetical protein